MGWAFDVAPALFNDLYYLPPNWLVLCTNNNSGLPCCLSYLLAALQYAHSWPQLFCQLPFPLIAAAPVHFFEAMGGHIVMQIYPARLVLGLGCGCTSFVHLLPCLFGLFGGGWWWRGTLVACDLLGNCLLGSFFGSLGIYNGHLASQNSCLILHLSWGFLLLGWGWERRRRIGLHSTLSSTLKLWWLLLGERWKLILQLFNGSRAFGCAFYVLYILQAFPIWFHLIAQVLNCKPRWCGQLCFMTCSLNCCNLFGEFTNLCPYFLHLNLIYCTSTSPLSWGFIQLLHHIMHISHLLLKFHNSSHQVLGKI